MLLYGTKFPWWRMRWVVEMCSSLLLAWWLRSMFRIGYLRNHEGSSKSETTFLHLWLCGYWHVHCHFHIGKSLLVCYGLWWIWMVECWNSFFSFHDSSMFYIFVPFLTIFHLHFVTILKFGIHYRLTYLML
jgi:hypothetical protein